jgi:phosphoribosylglycinamide formyltransferase 1
MIISNKNNCCCKLIYRPQEGRPMEVVVFASGSGGNFLAAINVSKKNPGLLNVGLLVTDRLGIKAIDIAREYNIPVIASDFEAFCGVWKECKNDSRVRKRYLNLSVDYHNNVLTKILQLEKTTGRRFDLVVLSYHRWIHGKLLDHFKDRIINQHAGDLSIMEDKGFFRRKYVGINPVLMALKEGETRTRTSTFLVGDGHDTGEILCQGPWVKYSGFYPVTKESAWEHELIQKKESDWPSLTFALNGIAMGQFSVSLRNKYPDGAREVFFKGEKLPYSGVDITNYD